jgi:signal transduction histidine kinase/CheY-like chemotaxis protein
MYKVNLNKIDLALKNKKNLHLLNEIKDNPDECSFGKILKDVLANSRYEYILSENSSVVYNLHCKWHHEFVQIKNAINNDDTISIAHHESNIKSLTKDLTKILDSSLKVSLNDGHVSLRSGMKAIRKIRDSFYKKNPNNLDANMQKKSIDISIERIIHSEFSWAIKEIHTSYEKLANNDYDIYKTIRFNSKIVHIQIILNEEHRNSYINEILILLLEVLELHFYVQERELSLIDFANKAQNANKSKDMFLANMSHELRTPINAITGFSQILMIKKDTPEFVKKYVKKINIAGNNLLDLVNTILDFAKLESGKMQFNPSLNSISKVIANVKDLITPLANKKNITLIMPSINSLTLYIDDALFKQVLINLFTNAIKFTHENGEVRLIIHYNQEKRKYIFEVKDNGVGLSKEDISKLFQSFAQVDNVYQKEHKGTGLGLMICKNIIEGLHKGKIWVESNKREGSSFFIEMLSPIIESNTYMVSNNDDKSKHILILEDNNEYQKILIEKLKPIYKLTITNSINKAKELIGKNKYDLLLLDYFLNDGISSEVLDFLNSENLSIPSIIISGEDEVDIVSSVKICDNLKLILSKDSIDNIFESIKNAI